jgi:penicillin-binding protein activator
MKTLRSLPLLAFIVPAVFILAGCETEPVRVDTRSQTALRSRDGIDVQDWEDAAKILVERLLASRALEKAPKQPAVLQIDRIINNTQQQIDTDSLVKKIRVQLNATGKVLSRSGSQLAAALKEDEEFRTGKKPTEISVDYTLSGKILENRVKVGTARQTTFTFQLSLTTVRDGLDIWEGEEPIAKGNTVSGAFGGKLGM